MFPMNHPTQVCYYYLLTLVNCEVMVKEAVASGTKLAQQMKPFIEKKLQGITRAIIITATPAMIDAYLASLHQ